MFGFSLGEILFLAILALVVIGPRQLPDVARQVARFLNELKRASSTFTDEIARQARIDIETPQPPPREAPVIPPPVAESEAVHPSGEKREG